MGLFDFLKGGAKKAQETAAGAAAGGGAMAAGSAEESAVSSLLGEGGTQLPALMDKLGAAGLGDATKSWVGTGPNVPVNADQVQSALGSDQVSAVASKLGISTDAAAAKIADVLPKVIDRLTPDGLVPDPEALANRLKGFIKL